MDENFVFEYQPDNGMQGDCWSCGANFHSHEMNDWKCDTKLALKTRTARAERLAKYLESLED
jgi:hypothetical protein